MIAGRAHPRGERPPVLPAPGKDHHHRAGKHPIKSSGDVSGSTPGIVPGNLRAGRPGHLKEQLRRRVSRIIRVVDERPGPSNP